MRLMRAVRRSANEATHLLAKEGCENKTCKVWCSEAPSVIGNQLVVDLVLR
jgi:hypothetical protein